MEIALWLSVAASVAVIVLIIWLIDQARGKQ